MYYDGGCPVCRRGVAHYQRLDWARRIAWIDITEQPDALLCHGVDFATAMDSLHVTDRSGALVSGAAGFVTIWSELPYYRMLAWLLRLPGLLPMFEWAYRIHSRGRYARRCVEDRCTPGQLPPR
jgi:predicted DCC family thiol-disulfide oxidoreductase YuxK